MADDLDTAAPMPIEGIRLRLRLVMPSDAAFIHALRTDPAYGEHLSATTGGVEDQRRWIESYKERESASQEFYFVAERLDGVPCGLVRIYRIAEDSFTWGSWIMTRDKPPKGALECALLSFDFCFYVLGLRRALVDVRRTNEHATAFYRRFGMSEIGRDGGSVYFVLTSECFQERRRGYISLIEGVQ